MPSLTANRKLVVFNKSKLGGTSFDLKSSESSSILRALKNETLKGDLASEQRRCQQHYLDKIFVVLFPESKPSESKDMTKSSDGYVSELKNVTNNSEMLLPVQ